MAGHILAGSYGRRLPLPLTSTATTRPAFEPPPYHHCSPFSFPSSFTDGCSPPPLPLPYPSPTAGPPFRLLPHANPSLALTPAASTTQPVFLRRPTLAVPVLPPLSTISSATTPSSSHPGAPSPRPQVTSPLQSQTPNLSPRLAGSITAKLGGRKKRPTLPIN